MPSSDEDDTDPEIPRDVHVVVGVPDEERPPLAGREPLEERPRSLHFRIGQPMAKTVDRREVPIDPQSPARRQPRQIGVVGLVRERLHRLARQIDPECVVVVTERKAENAAVGIHRQRRNASPREERVHRLRPANATSSINVPLKPQITTRRSLKLVDPLARSGARRDRGKTGFAPASLVGTLPP